MKKWLPYVYFILVAFILESYTEFIFVRVSLADFSFLHILKVVLLTEVSLNFARIPTGILLSLIVTNGRLTLFKKIALSILGLIAGALLYRVIAVHFVIPVAYEQTTEFFIIGRLNSAFLNVMFFSVLFLSFVQYKKNLSLKKNEESLRNENLTNELKFLKAQLNPHFLFNTLNNIYGLARKQDERTPEVILQLSDLLRFILYEANTKTISIGKELEIVEKYIGLEKIRYNKRLSINYSKEIENESFQLSPLLVIHLIENAFKHGISESSSNAFINIQIEQKDNACFIKVSNTKITQPTNHSALDRLKNTDSPIGLTNIRRQLDLSYTDYVFDVSETDDIFSIELKLPFSLQ